MQKIRRESLKRIAAVILSIIMVSSAFHGIHPLLFANVNQEDGIVEDVSPEREGTESEDFYEEGIRPDGVEYPDATGTDAILPLDSSFRAVVVVDTPIDLKNVIDALNSGSENTASILLSQVFLQNFNSTIILQPLNPGKEAEISAGGGTLSGIGAFHFRISGSDGSYILRDMFLDGSTVSSVNGVGGIFAGAEMLTLKNVRIENLTTQAVAGHKNLVVEDSVFRNLKERAIAGGSRVTVDNTLFENINKSAGHGSAIFTNSKLTVKYSSFINCGGGSSGSGYAHGAIGLHGGTSATELIVENCYFMNNVGNYYGGAISIYQGTGKAVITNSYFSGNEAAFNTAKGDGGAIGVYNNGQNFSLEVNGSTFYNNIACDDGGAIFVESNQLNTTVNVAVTNSTFVGNIGKSAKDAGAASNPYDGGGAIQISLNVYAVLENNTFYDNTKEDDAPGGAIGCFVSRDYILRQNPRYELKDNLFVGNTSGVSGFQNVHGVGLLNRLVIKGGNIGVDNGANLVNGLTVRSVFGTDTPMLEDNGSSISAGCSLSSSSLGVVNIIVPTLWIAPSLTSQGRIDGIHADGQGVGNRTADQRDKPRGLGNQLKIDAGAVDIVWAKFDANGGRWDQDEPYHYLGTLYEWGTDYLSNPAFTYAYVSGDSDMLSVTPPIDPVKDGYTFVGWADVDLASFPNLTYGDYKPAETEVTYYAVWKPLKANIVLTYWINGGVTTDSIQSVSEGYIEDDIISVKSLADVNPNWTPGRGFEFIGWSQQSGVSLVTDLPGDNIIAGTSDLNLYAQWGNLPSYKIIYDGNGEDSGNPPLDNNIYYSGEEGVCIDNTGNLKKNGYKFIGWNSDQQGTGSFYISGAPIQIGNSDVKLYAVWEKTYTITFESNGGSIVSPLPDLDFNTLITEPQPPIRVGYAFQGWFKDDTTFLSPWDFASDKVDSDRTLYAKWGKLYYVSYNGNGEDSGTVPIDAAGYLTGEEAVVLGNTGVLKRDGYKFIGWTLNGAGTGTLYQAGDKILIGNSDVDLYVVWEKLLTVTFESNGGSAVSPIRNLEYGSVITEPQPPAKAGYAFQGWFKDDTTFLSRWDFASEQVNADWTLYAKWGKLYYIYYNGNGEDSGVVPVDTNGYLSGKEAVILGNTGNLKKAGYKFIGWTLGKPNTGTVYPEASKLQVGNSDIILYASWEKLYTVKFESNGGNAVAPIVDIERGSRITSPVSPRRSGYQFAGWYKDDKTFQDPWIFNSDQVNDDIILFARWYEDPPGITKPENTKASVKPTAPTGTGIVGESKTPEESTKSGFELEYNSDNDYYIVLDENEVPIGYVKSPGDFTGPDSVVPLIPKTGNDAALVSIVIGFLGMTAAGFVIVKSYLDKRKREKDKNDKK